MTIDEQGAAERWGAALGARAIPDPILAAAPVSPWGFDPKLFASRADEARSAAPNPTTIRALEALPDRGEVLDIGCGGGATSVGLAHRASLITGVDSQTDMLDRFREALAGTGARVATVDGTWPMVDAPTADVVVSGHVLYNVADLAPFVAACHASARHRVVIEITDRHPLVWMNDLWLDLHGVRFPDGPTADDAADVITELGFPVRREDRHADDARRGGFDDRTDAIAMVRRRLCLGPEADDRIEHLLGDRLRETRGRWSAGPADGTPVTTLWWDTR
jgi:SAM-dependent methyltransferase